MKYWDYPSKIWQYPLFGIGFILFWMLYPVWVWKAKYHWKEDSAFILIHIEALFYNPWVLRYMLFK